MNSSDRLNIYGVKLLLSKRSSNFSIRLLIAIIEHWGKGSTFDLGLDDGRTFSEWSLDDLKGFVKTPQCEKFKITPDGESISENKSFFKLHIAGLSIPFIAPRKIGVKKSMTLKDLSQNILETSFAIWLEEIGLDKNVFKNTPRLTTSRNGRKFWITKAYEQGFVSNIDEFRLVCIGCRNSPYHMGYDQKEGTKRDKSYCDLKNILVNRQRVEEMMARASGIHYKEQLSMLVSKKEEQEKKIKEIYSFESLEKEKQSNEEDLDDGRFY